jgi:hypothetical protein
MPENSGFLVVRHFIPSISSFYKTKRPPAKIPEAGVRKQKLDWLLLWPFLPTIANRGPSRVVLPGPRCPWVTVPAIFLFPGPGRRPTRPPGWPEAKTRADPDPNQPGPDCPSGHEPYYFPQRKGEENAPLSDSRLPGVPRRLFHCPAFQLHHLELAGAKTASSGRPDPATLKNPNLIFLKVLLSSRTATSGGMSPHFPS